MSFRAIQNPRLRKNQHVMVIRTHEWAEKQLVSLLEVRNLGPKLIQALWKSGITTAKCLLKTPVEEVRQKLIEQGIFSPKSQNNRRQVKAWQDQIAALLAERENKAIPSTGWEKP